MKDFTTNNVFGALRLTAQGRLKDAVSTLKGMQADPSKADFGQFKNAPGPLSDVLEKLGRFGRFSPAPTRTTGVRPSGSRFEERDFSNAAGSRKYKLFVPSSYTGNPMPLVVMLHGCTQSPDDFAAGTRMNEIAEAQGFLVVYPAQVASANISKCWNWFNAADQQRDQGEPSIIAGITREIMDEFSVRHRKVYVAGLSAGGAMSAIMGAAYPELYAAIGVHSGLAGGAASDLTSAMMAMRRGGKAISKSRRTVPAIVFHGDRDMTVNIANAEQVIAQAKGNTVLRSKLVEGEVAGMKYTRTVQSARDGKSVLEEWVLHGAGHAWSGGSAAGSFTHPEGPDASGEMMRFFLAQ